MKDANGTELKRGDIVEARGRYFEVDDIDSGALEKIVALKKPKKWGGDPDALACEADECEIVEDIPDSMKPTPGVNNE